MEIKVRDNIIMKNLTVDNAAEIFGVIDRNRDYLRVWLPWVDGTDSVSVIENVIYSWQNRKELGTDDIFGIFKDDCYIGNMGLHEIKKSGNNAEIGYWLAENEQGNGIMTDCVKSLMDYAFNKFGIDRIYIRCANGNYKSHNIPKRIGFVHEKILDNGDSEYGMTKIRNVLKNQYDINCIEYEELYDGFYAKSYKIITDDKLYYLKYYNKSNTAVSIWTENINIYMSILIWLNDNTPLRDKIPKPLITINGEFRFDDESATYILFEYIDGETIGSKPLNDNQVNELAEIIAHLHRYDDTIPFDTHKIREDFSLPFCDSILKYLASDYSIAPDDIIDLLEPCIDKLKEMIDEITILSNELKSRGHDMRLCHTDTHNWNLMQTDHLILIDWEGLKVAPVEADLFNFKLKNQNFYGTYKKINPNFIMNKKTLKFYLIRRKLEDIWAFIESIVYDNQTPEQRERDITLLAKELADLNISD